MKKISQFIIFTFLLFAASTPNLLFDTDDVTSKSLLEIDSNGVLLITKNQNLNSDKGFEVITSNPIEYHLFSKTTIPQTKIFLGNNNNMMLPNRKTNNFDPETLHGQATKAKQLEIKHKYDDHSYNPEKAEELFPKSKRNLITLSHQHKKNKAAFMWSIYKFIIGG